jgi:hypothetical protein
MEAAVQIVLVLFMATMTAWLVIDIIFRIG